MYCKKCGHLISNESKYCEHCGEQMQQIKCNSNERQSNDFDILNENKKKKTRSIKYILKRFIIGGALCAIISGIISVVLESFENTTVELGDTINVEDVIAITFNEGCFYLDDVYPSNAKENSNHFRYEKEGIMFAVYGNLENLSTSKYDANDIVDAKLIIDDDYEFSSLIWFENDEGTDFLNFDISDYVYLDPEAIVYPKDTYNCALIGQIGTSVYNDLNSNSNIILELKFKDEIDSDSTVTYQIPLELNNKEVNENDPVTNNNEDDYDQQKEEPKFVLNDVDELMQNINQLINKKITVTGLFNWTSTNEFYICNDEYTQMIYLNNISVYQAENVHDVCTVTGKFYIDENGILTIDVENIS